jgi:hypothetical protein
MPGLKGGGGHTVIYCTVVSAGHLACNFCTQYAVILSFSFHVKVQKKFEGVENAENASFREAMVAILLSLIPQKLHTFLFFIKIAT